jgi:hypothetical protein
MRYNTSTQGVRSIEHSDECILEAQRIAEAYEYETVVHTTQDVDDLLDEMGRDSALIGCHCIDRACNWDVKAGVR